jgi:hypothetical protein
MAYTTIDDPSAYFQTALYSSDSSSVTVTNDGNSDLQPDWIWIKVRNGTNNHNTFDTSRGIANRLKPNDTAAEDGSSGVSVSSDGFATGTSLGDINNTGGSNTYVAWQWKANGGTTASNSNGTNITSTVQANTTAGFSIVTFTGTGDDGDSYGHGLSSAPELVFPKKRSGTSNWQGYAFDGGNSQYFYLNLTNAFTSTSGNSAASSSTVITTDGSGDSNPDGGTVVSYCFHSVQGYSKIGRYTGNGNADGPFVYTGFKPAWLMYRNTSRSENWIIVDNKRNTINPVSGANLQANVSDAEATETRWEQDFLSNGFKIRTDGSQNNANNGDGETIIYMAFAEHPFVSSEGVPATAR